MTAPATSRVIELTYTERSILQALLSEKWSSLDRSRRFLVPEDQETTVAVQHRIEDIQRKLR